MMNAVISQTAEYAVRAVVYLAANPAEHKTVSQIARAARIPSAYLSLIMKRLHRIGLVNMQRGLGGGFQLARPPATITMWEIVRLFDPSQPSWSPLDATVPAVALLRLQEQLDAARVAIQKQLAACKVSRLVAGRHLFAGLGA